MTKQGKSLLEQFYQQRIDKLEHALTNEEIVDQYISLFMSATMTNAKLISMASYYML
jgi:cytochrome P450